MKFKVGDLVEDDWGNRFEVTNPVRDGWYGLIKVRSVLSGNPGFQNENNLKLVEEKKEIPTLKRNPTTLHGVSDFTFKDGILTVNFL
jgi:hypothetical protein